MKKQRILLALACLLLPVLLRGIWFYQGFYFGNSDIYMPDFSSLAPAQPELSTAAPLSLSQTAQRLTVLVDQAHNNQFSLAEIEPLRAELLTLGAELLTLSAKNDLDNQLGKADALIIIAPVKDFIESEIESIEEFVHRGGRLLVIADPTRSFSEYDTERAESVILVNELLQPYQMTFRNDYAYNLTHNEGNYRKDYVYPSTRDPLTASVTELVFYAAHSLELYDRAMLASEENTLSSLDDLQNDLVMAALDASGNVLAVGDLTFMVNPYDRVLDNHRLIQNIAGFLLNGSRIRDLYDFPNLFNQDIAIRLLSGISFDQDLMAAIADVKALYSLDDLAVEIQTQPDAGYDRIVLGIYPPDDQLDTEIASFGISFNGSLPAASVTPVPTSQSTPAAEKTIAAANGNGRYFQVPGFGDIPAKGFGFILLKHEQDVDTLYLLADSQPNAVLLLGQILKGSLENCLFTDTIAVCEQAALAKNDIFPSPELTATPPDVEAETTPTSSVTFTPESTVSPLPDLTPTATTGAN